jgi:hypothetical protein
VTLVDSRNHWSLVDRKIEKKAHPLAGSTGRAVSFSETLTPGKSGMTRRAEIPSGFIAGNNALIVCHVNNFSHLFPVLCLQPLSSGRGSFEMLPCQLDDQGEQSGSP